MKFYKVSLEQFTKDYLKCNGYEDDYNLEIDDNLSKDIIDMWENIKLPKRSTSGSAGYDFFAPFDLWISGVVAKTFPTGIRFECDKDKFLMCVPRSGQGFKHGVRLLNTVGIIDQDYFYSDNEGHIMCKMIANDYVDIQQGKAFMQGIILPYFKVDNDDSDEVRNGGFGSTGM